MKKTLKSMLALVMVVILCFTLSFGISVSADGTTETVTEVIITDEENDELTPAQEFCTVISDEVVKFGSYAYKSTTANAEKSESWLFRSANNTGGLPRTLDISSMVEGGAVRFWIYVEDMATVHNWNGSQVQFGSNGWDTNVFKWNGWHTQIVNNGWNEIILPFASAKIADGKKAETTDISVIDTTAMTWFFIKTSNVNYATTVYLDNIRVTADCVAESNEKVLATADWSKEITVNAGNADPSDEKAAVGKKSYKSTTGTNGDNFWIVRGTIPSVDLSDITQSGTAGALRFKIYVEDITTLENWNGSQVQFGSGGWDSYVYQWNDFRGQIINNGWNDITLPFAQIAKTHHEPDLKAIDFISIRTNNKAYSTTVYVDDIRVTPTAEVRSDFVILNEENGETAFTDCTSAAISDEQAKVGSKSYKSAPSGSYWVLKNTNLSRKYDISTLTNNGTTGAVRFWVYVNDTAELANWGTTNNIQVQYGSGSWDTNVYKWSGWHNQIVNNGWNEIVLPFASVSATAGTPDVTNMKFFFIKLGSACDSVIYIDDIRVTASAANYEDVKLINEETGVTLGGSSFCAATSSEQASDGTYSYKSDSTKTDRENWILRGTLPRTYDLSGLSKDGTSGALKFSIYVEDITEIEGWFGNNFYIQAAIGTALWENHFCWNFKDQITQNGWNEIVLPLVDANKIGTVSSDYITYLWLRVGNTKYTSTIYVDNIRFESRKIGDVNADYSIDSIDLVALKQLLLNSGTDSFADINEDTAVNIIDLIRMKKNLAKLS